MREEKGEIFIRGSVQYGFGEEFLQCGIVQEEYSILILFLGICLLASLSIQKFNWNRVAMIRQSRGHRANSGTHGNLKGKRQ